MTQEQKDFIYDLLGDFIKHDTWTWGAMCNQIAADIDWNIPPVLKYVNGERVAIVTLTNGKLQEIGCNSGAYWVKGQ